MIDFLVISGHADERELGWIASLYGEVDAKYASLDFLRHQFVDNPIGWSAHVFALDEGRPVGHVAAVPCRARTGSSELVAAKVEALVVAPSHRGRRVDGRSLPVVMSERLRETARERGAVVLFALATDQANRVFERAGFHPVQHGAFSLVLVTRPQTRSQNRRVASGLVALMVVQRFVLAVAFGAARLGAGFPSVSIRTPDARDAELTASSPRSGWTISGDDNWAWLTGSGLLHTVEISGPHGSRAVVRLPSGAGDDAPAQIVAWEPRRPGARSAILLLGFVARHAHAAAAPTVRFQPWPDNVHAHNLERMCRRLGFVRRSIVALELDGEAELDDAVVSPFFYVTF